jgi:TfoX/Sxy family transcriptional regulator of competence genes
MIKHTAPEDGDALKFYEKLVATQPGAERRGATLPYTSVNGHMFSFLTKSGRLALRLPEGARGTFLSRYGAQLCEQNGTVMKEYVEVPDALLRKTAELKECFDLSYAYVSSLKPRPTARKRKQ